ncbi:hypothetical protein Goklo_022229 [Gossypium klotzschianum]|uniref:AT-hook motif nuclear-localized protein n=1 Tax=Gossypium klotzschianum TaxID=34286 RepID=A0A7J8TM19_9ROSI|nr:hypothetical protein [Gossypium klotzschianum]
MCLGGSSEMMKKKRGRPRKYGADGCLAMALSGEMVQKSQHKYEIESSPPARGTFYWDVTMKAMSFSQQGGRSICILSANGTISNVTLRQPTSSGGTLTYEGWFEILSLSDSVMPTQNGGTKSRSGGMSISLAGPNGHVLGGGLAGLLVAAGPVQVTPLPWNNKFVGIYYHCLIPGFSSQQLVVGSFLPGHQQEQKYKQQRTKAAVVSHTREFKVSYGGVMPILTSASFPIQGFRDSAIDSSKTSSAGEESKGHSPSQCEFPVVDFK